MWLILALITAVIWAIGNVLLKQGVTVLPRSLMYLGNSVFFLGLWLIYLLINGGWQSHWLAWVIALLPPLGFIYALTALRKNEAGLVLAMGSIHPAVTALLAIGFLGEQLNLIQSLLVAVVILGAVIMAWPGKIVVKSRAWVWWGLVFGLWSGLNNFVSKIGINLTNSTSYSLMMASWQMLIAIILLSLEKQWGKMGVLFKSEGRIGLVGTGIYNLGSVAFFLALGMGQASLVMPVVNLSTPMILFLAWWWLKEKMTRRQIIGAGVIVASVIGLSILS